MFTKNPFKKTLLFLCGSLVLLFSIGLISRSKPGNITLQKIWETDTLLNVPESALYDAERKIIYVSNINGKPGEKDGNGFISRVSISGKIETLEWIKGLDAPKGMGLYQNKLYVSDLSRVVVINIPEEKIEKSIEIPGAVFLNDLSIDRTGVVYLTDSFTKKIFRLQGDVSGVWLEHPDWQKPNGILTSSDHLHMLDMNSGKFYKISYSNAAFSTAAKNIPSGDGIVEIARDEYIVSNWQGELLHIRQGVVRKILDTKAEKLNAADIAYIPAEKLLLVPTFFGNTIAAYRLKGSS